MKIGHDMAMALAKTLSEKFHSKVEDGMAVPLGDIQIVLERADIVGEWPTVALLAVIEALLKNNTTGSEPTKDTARSPIVCEDTYVVKDINVNHPSHYNAHAKECIVEMYTLFGLDKFIDFCTMNAWKYRYRAGSKQGSPAAQDNAKADRYIEYARRAKECVYWELDPKRLTDDEFWDDFYNRTYRVKGLTPTMSPDIYQETSEDA